MKRNLPYEAWNTKCAKLLKYHFFIPNEFFTTSMMFLLTTPKQQEVLKNYERSDWGT